MWQWLRKSIVAGFFVTVPLAVSLIALVWVFRLIDGATSGLFERAFGFHVPGLGILAAIVLLVAARMALGLGWRPDEIFTIEVR